MADDGIEAFEAIAHEAGVPLEGGDLRRLLELLVRLGATREDVEQAARARSFGDLALELTLRRGEVRPFAEAVAAAGLSFEEAATYWQALGFAAPTAELPRLTADAVEGLRLMRDAAALLGEEQTVGLARVVGSATSRMAQAVVDGFRTRFEAPRLAAGVPYSEVVESYVELTRVMLPAFLDAVSGTLRGHLVNVAGGAWSMDAEGGAAQRDLLVGFVDISGYTAVSRTLTPGELARLVDDFERVVNDVMARHRAQVVKQLGDGALFAAGDVDDGCRAALDVLGTAGASSLPPLRVGLAAGRVVSQHGDLFGDVVNLAARLVAVAPVGAAVAAPSVRERAGGFRFDPLPAQELKGLPTPEAPFLLVGPA